MRKRWSGYGSYEEFLASPEWAKCRDQAFARDGGECVLCGRQERLEGHHHHYRRPLDPDTVATLCHWCHERHHEIERYQKKKMAERRRGRLNCKRCSGRYYCEDHE